MPGIGGGYVGVDVFFVISGFLITGLLWRELSSTGTVRLRGFYGARARRLLPASAAVGVITMIASALLLPPLQARPAITDGIASALYVSNYQFVLRGVDYFASHVSPSPFLHYWSLGVEEQFYLVWAPMILGTAWLIRRVRRRTSTRPPPRAAPTWWSSRCCGRVVRAVVRGHLRRARRSVLFAAHPRLAAGPRRARRPDGRHWRRLPARPPRSPAGPVWP